MTGSGVAVKSLSVPLSPVLDTTLPSSLTTLSDNPLAIVPFEGEILNDVINVLDSLGLKRNAEEDLVSLVDKKRRISVVQEDIPMAVVSSYADRLRKAKIKAKSSTRRRVKGGQENLLVEDLEVDNEMLDQGTSNSAESTFVFKAKRGGKKRNIVVGSDPEVRDVLIKLIEWNRREFPNFKKIIEHIRDELNGCHMGTASDEKLLVAESLMHQIEEAWDREETYWWQRSRIAWLRCGDRNTRFFHSSVVQRRQRNKIMRLKNENGVWLEDRKAIHAVFSDYYKKLFSSGGSRPMGQALTYVKEVLSAEDNSVLTQPVTNQEIEAAMFQIDANKAPGPDGFSALFYQSAWGTVNQEGNQTADSLAAAAAKKMFQPSWLLHALSSLSKFLTHDLVMSRKNRPDMYCSRDREGIG
ncbi:hypothetical protein K1719_022491 [Acacia pycnantha]|nr:hypothetical protein K1719_022491 [Acacia pycnantha]